MKTIDVTAMQWRDRTYGNAYTSVVVTIDYGMDSAQTIKVPLQYGHDHMQIAREALAGAGVVVESPFRGLHGWCRDNGVILRECLHTGCRKRDAVALCE